MSQTCLLLDVSAKGSTRSKSKVPGRARAISPPKQARRMVTRKCGMVTPGSRARRGVTSRRRRINQHTETTGLDSGTRREAVGKGKIGHSNSQAAVNILLPYSNDLFLQPSPAVAARRRAPEQMLHGGADWTPPLRPRFPHGRVRRWGLRECGTCRSEWHRRWEDVPAFSRTPGGGQCGYYFFFCSLPFWMGRMASRRRAGERANCGTGALGVCRRHRRGL